MSVPVKNLIVDSSPLLTAPVGNLRGLASKFLVTPDVVKELRDKNGRRVLEEGQIYLPSSEEGVKSGFTVREPSAEAVSKVTAFARKTGDFAVLSATDIRVLALCLTLELEENGSWRVREYPGQILSAPPKVVSEASEADGKPKETDQPDSHEMEKNIGPETLEASTEVTTNVTDQSNNQTIEQNNNRESEADKDIKHDLIGDMEKVQIAETLEPDADEHSQLDASTTNNAQEEEEKEGSNEGDSDSDSDGGEWITPENVEQHKAKDLGLDPLKLNGNASKVTMKAAVLTGDFAMQNVGLQMGLNVLGNGGRRVRNIKTWVLRCHACFKLCKNVEKRFCPSCGGATLLRTSITYVTPDEHHPEGYILHLKSNFQYKLRGTQYSIPSPKMGKAGGLDAAPVLREDQKEWTRGVKSQRIQRDKQERAASKGDEWIPAMFLGEQGRKNSKGGGIRLDSSGLPVLGGGKRNVNESKRKRR